MGLNAVLVLMPDRTDVELIFLDAESGLGLGELDIGLPELLIAPIVEYSSTADRRPHVAAGWPAQF